jgi:hypothetical protein
LPGEKGIHVTYIEVNYSATAVNANLAKIASGFYSKTKRKETYWFRDGQPTLRATSKSPSLPGRHG